MDVAEPWDRGQGSDSMTGWMENNNLQNVVM
jgi:hypothetical protein